MADTDLPVDLGDNNEGQNTQRTNHNQPVPTTDIPYLPPRPTGPPPWTQPPPAYQATGHQPAGSLSNAPAVVHSPSPAPGYSLPQGRPPGYGYDQGRQTDSLPQGRPPGYGYDQGRQTDVVVVVRVPDDFREQPVEAPKSYCGHIALAVVAVIMFKFIGVFALRNARMARLFARAGFPEEARKCGRSSHVLSAAAIICGVIMYSVLLPILILSSNSSKKVTKPVITPGGGGHSYEHDPFTFHFTFEPFTFKIPNWYDYYTLKDPSFDDIYKNLKNPNLGSDANVKWSTKPLMSENAESTTQPSIRDYYGNSLG